MTTAPPTIPISFRLRPKLAHRLKILACGVVCVAGSAAVIALADTSSERLVGYIGLGFFIFCLVSYLVMLSLDQPRIDIDQDGVYVNASLADGIRLAWDEIGTVERTSMFGQDMIIITPRPGIPWQKRLSPFARLLARLNRNMGFDGIVLGRANLGDQYDLAFFALQNSLAHACPDR